jgi:general stress protein YciG
MASKRKRDGANRGDRRGFASMDPQKQRAIAKKGGEASARMQRRDSHGQFAGSGSSSRTSASGSGSASSSRGSNSRQGSGRGRRSSGSSR